jgi:DNA repair exonuclease SbcCD ATPase subunit
MPEEALETQELKERLEENQEELDAMRREVEKGPTWTLYLSLSTAIIAVFAAVASLKSGSNANEAILAKNEAVLAQARASDRWAYYQSKGIKHVVYAVQAEALAPTNPAQAARFREEANRYKSDQEALERAAKELEKSVEASGLQADESLERHHRFAISVTVFQVAIALAAIAALARRRPLWFVSLAVGAAGLFFFLRGFFAA